MNEQMRVTTETITPHVAEIMLMKNTRNRSANLNRVATIAAAIESGHFMLNGDAIRFGKDGTLYDGQHRLMAVCKAGRPIESVVVRGLEPEARDVIDMGGAGRTARDVLQITDGVTVPKMHVGWLVAADVMLATGSITSSKTIQSTDWLRSACKVHGEAVAAMCEVFGRGNKRILMPASSIGMLLITHRVYPAETTKFAIGVKMGEGLSAGDPRLTFRNYLIGIRGNPGGGTIRDDVAQRTLSAFDAYLRGDSMKLVKANATARDKFVAAWKAWKPTPAVVYAPEKKAPPSAPVKFADAIRASQLKETKKRTPDAPPPPVAVVPPKRSSTKTLAQIADVREYLSDGKTHKASEIAEACAIPRGSIYNVLTEALDVYNVSPGVWAMKKNR